MNDTLKQRCVAYLVSNGMFENEANDLFELFISEESNQVMAGRWNSCASDYPAAILNMSLLSLKAFAFEWIKENKPMAWYLPMFAQ